MASGKVHAIETWFDGCRFRSRLEARWSVWLNALGIPYRYEAEAFDLEGVLYLPDFWLPEQQAWMEIKGELPTEQEQQKCRLLAQLTGYRTLLICGEPGPHYVAALYEPEGIIWGHLVFALGRRDERELWVVNEEDHLALCLNPLEDSDRYPQARATTLLSACAKARQARFDGWWRKHTGSDLAPRRGGF